MQEQTKKIEAELNQRIYKHFLVKFNGNKSAFARAAECTEGTVRRVFRNQQSITFNLLLRFCFALEIEVTELVQGLKLKAIKK